MISPWNHRVALQDIDAAGIAFCGHCALAHQVYEELLLLLSVNLLQPEGQLALKSIPKLN